MACLNKEALQNHLQHTAGNNGTQELMAQLRDLDQVKKKKEAVNIVWKPLTLHWSNEQLRATHERHLFRLWECIKVTCTFTYAPWCDQLVASSLATVGVKAPAFWQSHLFQFRAVYQRHRSAFGEGTPNKCECLNVGKSCTASSSTDSLPTLSERKSIYSNT